MWHQADDVALFAAKPGDVGNRSIGVRVISRNPLHVCVAKHDLAVSLEPGNNVRLSVVIALTMRDWDAKDLPRGAGGSEWRICMLHLDQHMLALVFQAAVTKHRTWKQAGFEQHLKTVADAKHGAARRRKLLHLRHDGREARDGAGAEVVPVRKAAWEDDHIRAFEAGLLVPDVIGLLAENVLRSVMRVVVAIGSGENDDSELHAVTSSPISIR